MRLCTQHPPKRSITSYQPPYFGRHMGKIRFFSLAAAVGKIYAAGEWSRWGKRKKKQGTEWGKEPDWDKRSGGMGGGSALGARKENWWEVIMGKQLPERQTRICGKQQVVGESILTLILHLSADDCGTHCLQSDLSLRMAIVTKTSCDSMAMWVPPVPTK